jgi:hypothetical protein
MERANHHMIRMRGRPNLLQEPVEGGIEMARKARRPVAKPRKKRRNAKGKPATKHEPSPTLQKTQIGELTDVLDVDRAQEITEGDDLVVEEEEELGNEPCADPHGEGRPPHND